MNIFSFEVGEKINSYITDWETSPDLLTAAGAFMYASGAEIAPEDSYILACRRYGVSLLEAALAPASQSPAEIAEELAHLREDYSRKSAAAEREIEDFAKNSQNLLEDFANLLFRARIVCAEADEAALRLERRTGIVVDGGYEFRLVCKSILVRKSILK